MDDTVAIEYIQLSNGRKTVAGSWQRIRCGILNDPQLYNQEAYAVQRQFNFNVRIRVVEESTGRVVDILSS